MIRISQKQTDRYLYWVWKWKRIDSEPINKQVTCTDPRCLNGTFPCFDGKPVPCSFNTIVRECANPKWQKWLYQFSSKCQLFLMKIGISLHNPVSNECCPDFSCCWDDIPEEHKSLVKGLADAAKKDNPIFKIFKLGKTESN